MAHSDMLTIFILGSKFFSLFNFYCFPPSFAFNTRTFLGCHDEYGLCMYTYFFKKPRSHEDSTKTGLCCLKSMPTVILSLFFHPEVSWVSMASHRF